MAEISEDDIERVACEIYGIHWKSGSENRGHRFPPTWEDASENVSIWVRAQAISAINAYEARNG